MKHSSTIEGLHRTLGLAWAYLRFNRWKSLTLVACMVLTLLLPIAIKVLLSQFDAKVSARADRTPIVIGDNGSALDLALHALYFRPTTLRPTRLNEVHRIEASGLAQAIPIHAKFTARQFPIVGTTIDYLTFRQLQFSAGTPFVMLGECVVGARVAQQLGLQVDDRLLSDRESVIDLAGLYPLKMRVTGVLEPTRTADDSAVFVDLKTAWVIQGLGHGHQDLQQETDEGKILSRDARQVVASAAVLPYTEITDQNRASFHFHGDVSQFPVTAIIAVAADSKSLTLLEGQYDVSGTVDSAGQTTPPTGSIGDKPSSSSIATATTLQLIEPKVVFQDLMNTLFRIKLFFDANTILVAISTLMLLGLIMILSFRLRQREMETMFKIGCSRSTIGMLQLWELAIVLMVAIVLVAAATWMLQRFAGTFVEALLLAV